MAGTEDGDDRDRPAPRRAISPILTILAGLILGVVLVGSVIPSVGRPRSRPQPIDATHMRGIVSVLIAYQTDFGDIQAQFPAIDVDDLEPWAACERTVATYQTLQQTYPEDLPTGIFAQRQAHGHDQLPVPAPVGWLGFAFDWGAPADAGTNRVLLCQRPPLTDEETVYVVFGDGHAARLSVSPLPDGPVEVDRRTLGRDGRPVRIRALTTEGDDIFQRGDGGVDDVWVR